MKFKVGDKVVRIKRNEETFGGLTNVEYDVGDSFVITDIADHGVIWGEMKPYGMFQEELELESVYNSKLYKALK